MIYNPRAQGFSSGVNPASNGVTAEDYGKPGPPNLSPSSVKGGLDMTQDQNNEYADWLGQNGGDDLSFEERMSHLRDMGVHTPETPAYTDFKQVWNDPTFRSSLDPTWDPSKTADAATAYARSVYGLSPDYKFDANGNIVNARTWIERNMWWVAPSAIVAGGVAGHFMSGAGAAAPGSGLGGGAPLIPTQLATGAGSLSGAGVGTAGLAGAGGATGLSTGLGSASALGTGLGTPAGIATGGPTAAGIGTADTVLPSTATTGAASGLPTTGGSFAPYASGTAATTGGGSVVNKLLNNKENLADIAQTVSSYGQAQANNRGVAGNYMNQHDKNLLEAANQNRLQETDALRKLLQSDYIAGGGARPINHNLNSGISPNFGEPTPPSASTMQAAAGLRDTLMKRLTPAGQIQISDPSQYTQPGTGENIANYGSLGLSALDLISKYYHRS